MCELTWKLGKTPKGWHSGVIISTYKAIVKSVRISLLSLPGKVYAKYLERKRREIVELKLEDG